MKRVKDFKYTNEHCLAVEACNTSVYTHTNTHTPVGLNVVGATKELNLPGPWRQSLDHPIDLIRLVTSGAHLRQEGRTKRQEVILIHNSKYYRNEMKKDTYTGR